MLVALLKFSVWFSAEIASRMSPGLGVKVVLSSRRPRGDAPSVPPVNTGTGVTLAIACCASLAKTPCQIQRSATPDSRDALSRPSRRQRRAGTVCLHVVPRGKLATFRTSNVRRDLDLCRMLSADVSRRQYAPKPGKLTQRNCPDIARLLVS